MNEHSKTRILFVDDEPAVIHVLRLSLRKLAAEWEVFFAASGNEALALMAQQPLDIVVSDMRMPGMTGAELLNRTMQLYPRTVRIILSGYSEEEVVRKSIGVTHQWLMKPIDLSKLRSILNRIHKFNQRLTSEEVRAVTAKISHLPSIPAIYFKIMEALQSPDAPLEQIGEIVATDPPLTAKTLQLVNSAFFGYARDISNATDAVQLLGVNRIRSLALALHLFSAFDTSLVKTLPLDALWNHSVRAAVLAARIASLEGKDEDFIDQTFTAGLLHDVGKLILAANLPQAFTEILNTARTRQKSLAETEIEILHASHADAGGFLLGVWGLPVPLVEAVAFHHRPMETAELQFSPLTAVHVANFCEQKNHPGELALPTTPLDLNYLAAIGMQNRLVEWQKPSRES
jgi:HD-like signal output (HDOD) protein